MIIVKLMGGLGNQMFQYAVGRHLAEIHKTTLKLDLTFLQDRTPRENFIFRNFDLDIFNIQQKIATVSDLDTFFRKPSGINQVINKVLNTFTPSLYIKEAFFHYNPEILKSAKNVYLEGYWQSQKYFEGIEGLLRKEFTFKSGLDNHFTEIASKIQSANSVCIHVRRTDFLNNPYHPVCEVDYYRKAVTILSHKLMNINLYVFSDDIEWCINNLTFDFPTYFIKDSFEGKRISHCLQLMSLCKHYVISNSTFSWWAAWLSSYKEKIVIAPEKWFNDSSVNTEDLIPDSWQRI